MPAVARFFPHRILSFFFFSKIIMSKKQRLSLKETSVVKKIKKFFSSKHSTTNMLHFTKTFLSKHPPSCLSTFIKVAFNNHHSQKNNCDNTFVASFVFGLSPRNLVYCAAVSTSLSLENSPLCSKPNLDAYAAGLLCCKGRIPAFL